MLQSIGYDITQAIGEMVNSGLLTSLIQFQKPDGTFGPSGAPGGNFVNVPGLVDLFTGSTQITCIDAPLSPGTISALEAKALEEIEGEGMRHVALNGYYPQIVTNWQGENENMNWRAQISGINYEVFGVETDSQRTQTRVKLRLITV